jgi:hypothetical protein
MVIPTLQWLPTPLTGGLGSYVNWNGTPVDGEAMVTYLINTLKVFMQSTTSFDQVTAYTQATPTSPNIPRASVALGIPGTSISTAKAQAVSYSFMFKTLGNHDAKLVLLDAPIGSNWFAPQLPADFTADVLTLEGAFIDAGWAWSGRDDTKPDVLRKITFDLNDKLQRQYWK